MTDEPTRPTQSTSERVDRERRFHDALTLSGRASIATKEWWETPGGRVRFSRRISMLQQSLPELSNTRHRILVIGCGDGEWVNAISEFAEVVGIDISPEVVAKANSQLHRSDYARIEVGDAHQLKYADGAFDVCFANSALHHLDLAVVIPEVFRVLRKGGKLIAGEPNRGNPFVWWMFRSPNNRTRFGVTPDEDAFTRFAIVKILRNHFRSIKVANFDFWHPSFGGVTEKSLAFRFTLALEKIPIIREFSGSLWIEAYK